METYSQHIELINDYLNNSLSKEAQIDFESKLQNDAEFNAIYKEHIIFVNGLKRINIKSDIQKAKRSYITEKWLKISGISIIIIGALVMLYTLVFNTSEIEPNSTDEHQSSIISNNPSEEKQASEISIDTLEVKNDSTASQIEVSYVKTSEQKRFGGISSTKIELKKRSKTHNIGTSKDTVIRCQEGTILRIKAGSFMHPNTGQAITGKVDLKVTEYYKLSDILITNLTTTSNGKPLETGGMIHIEAKQANINLELKDDKPIDILFPTQNKKPDMQLFSGKWEDDTMNWTLQDDELEAIEVSEKMIETLEETIEVPFHQVEQAPTFPGCEAKDNDSRKLCTVEAISKFVNQNFNKDITSGLGLTGKQRINCFFKIDLEGNITFIQTRAPNAVLSQEADRVIRLLPKMSPGLQRGRPVMVPYSLPITFNIEGNQNLTNQNSRAQITDSVIINSDIAFDPTIRGNSIKVDTVYSNTRGIQETIREIMHDKDFVVDSVFIKKWNQYKEQRLIRNIQLETKPNYFETAVILRKPLFGINNTEFKILEDDSISRGGHIIRIPWDDTKIPSRRVMKLVPKQLFSVGQKTVTAEEFEAKLGDKTDTSISSRHLSYYVLRTARLGWINCDRFISPKTKRIKYKLKIKNADDATISMVFKSINSVLPGKYNKGFYDFQTILDNEDVILVAIKRYNGKLYIDTIETKTEENPQISFEFKEVTTEELKTILEQLNGTFK
nr:hypothetical protein [uncultured Psychroserpens sp.]